MTKIRSVSQLQDLLDDEFSWRLKEIHEIRSAAKTAGPASRSTFIRAGVALLYAHWEGFVKAGADGYINYLSCKGLRNSELRSCFAALALKKHLHNFGTSNRSTASISALDVIVSEFDKPARFPLRNSIDTHANLSSQTFGDVLRWLGLDQQRYSTKFQLLDRSLLSRRNRIAHGHYLELDESSFVDLIENVLQLLRWFKTDIENALATQAFLKTSPRGSS